MMAKQHYVFFWQCLLYMHSTLAYDSTINQLYLSINANVTFKPTNQRDRIAQLTVTGHRQCPYVCLGVSQCQLVTFNSTDVSCTVYNSTSGRFQPQMGNFIYTVQQTAAVTTMTTTTTAGTSRITTATSTPPPSVTSAVSMPSMNAITAEMVTETTATNTRSVTSTSSMPLLNAITPEAMTATTATATSSVTSTVSMQLLNTITTGIATTASTSVIDCSNSVLTPFNTQLVVLWRFDNNANADQAMYNGMLNGDGIFNPSSGYINGDVYLQNGGSSYIQTPTVNIFGMSFTVELWLRIETLPASGSVVLFSQNDLILRINNNGRVTINAASPSSGTILGANKWYHVALVYTMTSEQQDIYVNGYLDSSSSQGLTSTANNSFFIGSSSGVGEYFVGEIDHLSIAARAKSACDILQDASLVASYSFSQGANASQDSGPNGFNGFISGTVNYVSSGAVGSALSFSGSSDYFQANGLTALTIVDSSFTFALFIQPSSIRVCSLIFLSNSINNTQASHSKPYLGIDSFGNLIAEIPPGIGVNSSATLLDGQWNHAALTYNFPLNQISLYFNGLLKVTVAGPSPHYNPPVTTPPAYVTLSSPLHGANGNFIVAQPFKGILDEFNIWSRALSAAEIHAIAQLN